MPFGSFTTIGDALSAMRVTEVREEFLMPQPTLPSDYFRQELEYTLANFDVECSEWAVCENLLYPVLREAMKPFRDVLGVWSHIPLYHGQALLGIPDYIIAKRSQLSVRIWETPFAMIMEAKRNDFDAGWAQCLAAMCAVQSLNGSPKRVIYGGVSDGWVWRFGKLFNGTFTHHSQVYTLGRLDELFGALNHVLDLCKQQILSPAEAA